MLTISLNVCLIMLAESETSGISVSMPRVSTNQRHHSNPKYASVDDYFKNSITIPFLDQLISDITSRFTSHCKPAASLQNLVPINISNETDIGSLQEAVNFY